MEAIADKIKGVQPACVGCRDCSRVKALTELAVQLQAKLIIVRTMYPNELQMAENALDTVEELRL